MIYRLVKMGVGLQEAREMTFPVAMKLMCEAGYESHLEKKSMDEQRKGMKRG